MYVITSYVLESEGSSSDGILYSLLLPTEGNMFLRICSDNKFMSLMAHREKYNHVSALQGDTTFLTH